MPAHESVDPVNTLRKSSTGAAARIGGFAHKHIRLVAALASLLVTCGTAPVASAFVYWTNRNSNTIGRANVDGSGVNQSFITGANDPFEVVVDGASIYWT